MDMKPLNSFVTFFGRHEEDGRNLYRLFVTHQYNVRSLIQRDNFRFHSNALFLGDFHMPASGLAIRHRVRVMFVVEESYGTKNA